MPESVTYVQDDGFIKVHSFGKTNIENWKNSFDQVIEIKKHTDCKSVLFDVREEVSTPDTNEIFDFGIELPDEIRIAVITPEIPSKEYDFLENVGVNRGKSIKLFKSYDKGVNWLKR